MKICRAKKMFSKDVFVVVTILNHGNHFLLYFFDCTFTMLFNFSGCSVPPFIFPVLFFGFINHFISLPCLFQRLFLLTIGFVFDPQAQREENGENSHDAPEIDRVPVDHAT